MRRLGIFLSFALLSGMGGGCAPTAEVSAEKQSARQETQRPSFKIGFLVEPEGAEEAGRAVARALSRAENAAALKGRRIVPRIAAASPEIGADEALMTLRNRERIRHFVLTVPERTVLTDREGRPAFPDVFVAGPLLPEAAGPVTPAEENGSAPPAAVRIDFNGRSETPETVFKVFFSENGFRKPAFYTPEADGENAGTHELETRLADMLRERRPGVPLVRRSFGSGRKSHRQKLAALKVQEPDVCFFGGPPGVLAGLFDEARRIELPCRFAALGHYTDEELKKLGPAAEGLLYLCPARSLAEAAGTPSLYRLQEKERRSHAADSGTPPKESTLTAFFYASLTADALLKAESLEPAAVAAAFRPAPGTETVFGPVAADGNGDIVRESAVCRFKNGNGERLQQAGP